MLFSQGIRGWVWRGLVGFGATATLVDCWAGQWIPGHGGSQDQAVVVRVIPCMPSQAAAHSAACCAVVAGAHVGLGEDIIVLLCVCLYRPHIAPPKGVSPQEDVFTAMIVSGHFVCERGVGMAAA